MRGSGYLPPQYPHTSRKCANCPITGPSQIRALFGSWSWRTRDKLARAEQGKTCKKAFRRSSGNVDEYLAVPTKSGHPMWASPSSAIRLRSLPGLETVMLNSKRVICGMRHQRPRRIFGAYRGAIWMIHACFRNQLVSRRGLLGDLRGGNGPLTWQVGTILRGRQVRWRAAASAHSTVRRDARSGGIWILDSNTRSMIVVAR
jgi:hypothetical protein